MLTKASVPAEMDPDLFELVTATLSVGDVVHTLANNKPNRLESIDPLGVIVTTEKSSKKGTSRRVDGWMFNVAWRELRATGRLTASDLVSVAKRSSAVCAILARLPGVEVVSHRPIQLAWRRGQAQHTIPAELLAAYQATRVTVEIDEQWLDRAQAVERIGSPLYVVTAWNPRGQELDTDENYRRHEQLIAAVERLDFAHYRAAGSSPDGAWTEQGVAIPGTDRDTAGSLGREFGQYAVFELTNDATRVIACGDSG